MGCFNLLPKPGELHLISWKPGFGELKTTPSQTLMSLQAYWTSNIPSCWTSRYYHESLWILINRKPLISCDLYVAYVQIPIFETTLLTILEHHWFVGLSKSLHIGCEWYINTRRVTSNHHNFLWPCTFPIAWLFLSSDKTFWKQMPLKVRQEEETQASMVWS